MKRPQGDPRRAVAYLRISTDGEKQIHGLEVQRASVEAWAQGAGVELVALHRDEISGTSKGHDRPGLGAALADLRRLGAGALVVLRLDRLARDLAEALVIERMIVESGAALIAVESGGNADDPASKFLRHVMLAASEFEGALIRQRIKATKASLRARGLLEGGKPPYGFRVGEGKRLEPHPEERAALEELQRMRQRGLSFRQVARQATARGLLNRAGHPWDPSNLRRLLGRLAQPQQTR